MKYQILRQETDMAGKIRCWVDIGNDEVQIFKFQKESKIKEIKTEVDKLIASQPTKEQELKQINQEISRLEERKKQLEGLK